MNNSRREFIKKAALGTAGFTIGGLGMSAKSYAKIIGANERIHVAIAGLGRRLGAYYEPISRKESNVELMYLCDVMQKQRESALQKFSKYIDYKPKLENDLRKVIADKNVDVLINATPDHWHTPGTCLAVQGGKHVYVEKPCSHNPREGEILVEYQKKYGKVIQMGNQQRSAVESIDIINQIHKGVIGTAYKAVAFYVANRGEVPVPKAAPVPQGLDWELFQGPAPRMDYTHDTWDYNWHWYGWLYGTAEAGNNATHELDVARWALQVEFPEHVTVEAAKRHFLNDGWVMYDTMDATYRFPGNKIIKWDGKSRNGYKTYGSDRGTIIYGTNGSVYVDRNGYKLFDRDGKEVKSSKSQGNEAGTALGGGGDMTTRHVVNFFEAVRGKEKQASTIEEGARSTLLCHLANIAYRTNKSLDIDPKNGHIHDKDAMKLWSREYAKGWAPIV
ncbi:MULTISPECIES: Gfo/Idh/MocA family oxidoreductase [unclassified Spirosoma]|uniref:Gfo/Idh/MocA family protein n=1 Tax=unclassified Spirosoma TaxID=2621999 RepID=UPI000969BCE1|nr:MULTISPECIES: Gfo/Idh/MocA family oxidoreductase [unclassified Spirosoma]MBN8825277.1 Gfo/Idh/MocA family oxidoreductase [Spirosoma sp.]OJW77549.1 MAG: dehydrogenase [Spirosoma sp. 48-14]